MACTFCGVRDPSSIFKKLVLNSTLISDLSRTADSAVVGGFCFRDHGQREEEANLAQVKNDFSQGSIPRNILSLALPMTAAQLVNVLYSVVDRIYLGRLPGSSHLALTGVGVTIPSV